ncbi:non-ribosomal peptide synthetase, partial [Nitrobacter vulgaris]
MISLQLVGRARQAGLLIEPRDVFRHQTLQELARVARNEPKESDAPPQGDLEGSDHPLLPIQARFFSEDAGERHHWNQAVLLIPKSRLDWAVVEVTAAAIVAHHAALRLSFEEIEGVWRASYGAASEVSELFWHRSGIRDAADVTAVASAAQASLSLTGPLLRLVGMDLTDGSQRLLLVVHHLVVDGVSWRVLLEDFAAAYEQIQQGKSRVMLAPSHSYASWGARLQAFGQTEQLAAELPYWLERGAQAELPCDDDAGIDRVVDGEEVSLAFDAELTARLLKEAPSAYRTQVNDLLLAGLARAIARWSGIEQIVVELEGHGREDIFAGVDISRTVGWFTTAFPVRLPGGSADDATLIKSTKEELRAIPARGLGYGVLRYHGTEAQRDALAQLSEPRIVFNYLGQFDSSFSESAPFRLAPESAGPARSNSAPLGRWLSINGQVKDGELRLSFSFGRKRYQRKTIELLAASYETAVRELVDHCTSGACGLTPSDVALSGLGQGELDHLALEWREIEDIYPLSPMQQGMLFHTMHDGERELYVNQVAAEVRGVNAEGLRRAWQAVSDRHAVLRTGFVWRGLSGSPQQIVYRRAEVPFVEDDWRARVADWDEAQLEAALADVSRQEQAAGFDLSRPPLQRVRLIRLGDDRHWLIWTHHHILFDGWSSARLISEVMQHHGAGRLPALQHRYRDYIAWLQNRAGEVSAAFWRDAMARLDQPSFLSERADAGSCGHGALTRELDAGLTEKLQQFAARERVTMNTLAQAAWAQLLRRHTGQSAVCFGVTVSGRPAELAGADEMIGLFINTLPVVDDVAPQQKVGAWLRELQDHNLALRDFGWTPLYEIQRLAGRPGQPLFDSILVFENYPIDHALTEKNQQVRVDKTRLVETSNYPLFASVGLDKRFRLTFNYQRRHFDEAQIARLQHAFVRLMEALSVDADRPVGMIADRDPADDVLLARANNTRCDEPRRGLIEQFESQVRSCCDGIALVFGDEALSYGELNARANRLAWRLRDRGVGT